MKKIFAICCLLYCVAAPAQVKMGDNPTSVNSNSLLELESSTKGLLLPRMTNTQIQAMSGVPKGMLVFSSTDSALYLRRDTGWVILSLASTPQSATNQWTTNGTTLYNTSAAKVGIGTNTPYSQLANTSNNILGSDGYGGNPGSFAWAANQLGYVAQVYNGGLQSNANGLALKVAATTGTALDVSQSATPGTSGVTLFTVKSGGNVGVGVTAPAEKLEVDGNIKYSGNLHMGVVYNNVSIVATPGQYGFAVVGCPSGTKLIGGGGGFEFDPAKPNGQISYSAPNYNNTSEWMLIVRNGNTVNATLRIFAICAKVQ